jgi:hypothetical protein
MRRLLRALNALLHGRQITGAVFERCSKPSMITQYTGSMGIEYSPTHGRPWPPLSVRHDNGPRPAYAWACGHL